MESVSVLLNDKKAFLHRFVGGEFEANPLVMGMVWGFCQKDLKDELSLFLALERLVNETRDEIQIFYSVFKMLKSGEFYLNANYNQPEFVNIYCKVVSLLANLKVPRQLESKVNYIFTENWNRLADSFAYSEAFVEVYWLGKRFTKLFSRLPMVFHMEIEKEMDQVVEFKSVQINKEFLLSLYGAMRFMKFYHSHKECANLASFFNFVLVFVYKNNENLEVLYELKKKVEEHYEVFSEQSRIDMNLEFKAAVGRLSGDTPDPMRAESLSRPKVSNLVESRSQVQISRPQNTLIKIPEKGYENPAPSPPAGYKQDPKLVKNQLFNHNQGDPYNIHSEPAQNYLVASRPDPRHAQVRHPNPVQKDPFFSRIDSAPSEISANNSETEAIISNLFEQLKDQFKTNQSIDSNQVQSILTSFEKESVTFTKDLKKVLRHEIEKNLKGEDFEFWDNIIDACRGILPSEEIADILKANEEKNRKMSSDEFLGRGQGMIRPRKSRPGSRRGVGGESRNFMGEYNEKYLYQGDYENEIRGQNRSEPSIEWSYESPNQSIQNEALVFNDPGLSNSFKASEPEKQKVAILEVDSTKLELADYIKLLNAHAQEIVKIIRSDTTEIISLNDVLISIKNEIKQRSPSCTFNLIGSAYLGTHIKNTPVDACFVDYLTPDPQTLLKSVIQKLGYDLVYEIDSFVIFKSKENEYRVYINQEHLNEASYLLKEYSLFGSLFQDLVILLKYWTISAGLYKNYLTGYHLNLICLCYLQCFEPPILPKLQQDAEESTGHWFKKNLEFNSMSSASVGDTFYYLFSTLITVSTGYICDPIEGTFIPNAPTSFLSCLNVINKNEVSSLSLQDPRSQEYIKLLHQASSEIANQKDLYKIMRLK